MARRKSDRDKGPIGAWATKQRDRRGWKQADVVRALAEAGAPITEGTYRGIEAGPRPPSRSIIAALERVFGSEAPDPHELPEVASTDLSLLLVALREQTDAIRGQTAAISELVERLPAASPDAEALAEQLGEALAIHLAPLLAGRGELQSTGSQ